MGKAVAQGLLHNAQNNFKLSACVRSSSSYQQLEQELSDYNTKVTLWKGHLVTAASIADVIVLGCKAEDLEELLKSEPIAQEFDGKLVISLMAGLSPNKLKSTFHSYHPSGQVDVVQAIPTIGAKTGDSVTLIDGANAISNQHKEQLDTIFTSIGSVKHIQESMMDDTVAIGAVAHAITILIIDALTDAGVAKGLPRSTVASLAAENIRSASSLLASGMSPESLKAAMSTPSGITLNSMLKLEAGGARSAIQGAATFAVDYARSMSDES